jgi:hypothetical protein
MFHRLAALAHRLRIFIEALLDSLQYVFMLPSRDPSLLASGAALFDGTALTGVSPMRSREFSTIISQTSRPLPSSTALAL